MIRQIKLKVNGQERTVEVDDRTPLLYVLRNDLGLNGPKYGCGSQQCGSCMVLLAGEARTTCLLPVSKAEGREIVTLEGLASGEKLHPVQSAFIAEQAAQCGYCLNGAIITGKALLDKNPKPTEQQIREGLKLVLCRCGTHGRMIRAIRRAAGVVA